MVSDWTSHEKMGAYLITIPCNELHETLLENPAEVWQNSALIASQIMHISMTAYDTIVAMQMATPS